MTITNNILWHFNQKKVSCNFSRISNFRILIFGPLFSLKWLFLGLVTVLAFETIIIWFEVLHKKEQFSFSLWKIDNSWLLNYWPHYLRGKDEVKPIWLIVYVRHCPWQNLENAGSTVYHCFVLFHPILAQSIWLSKIADWNFESSRGIKWLFSFLGSQWDQLLLLNKLGS